MERQFNHDEFEQFLQNSAGGLRMRPSPEVWKSLSKKLNRKRRRITGAVILLLTLVTAGYITWYAVNITPSNTAVSTTQEGKAIQTENSQTPVALLPQDIIPSLTTTTAVNNKATTALQRNVVPTINKPATAITSSTAEVEDVFVTDAAPLMEPEVSNVLSTVRPSTQSIDILPIADKKSTPALLTPEAFRSTAGAAPSITLLPRLRRWSLQLFLTPTFSYRKLADNKDYRRPILTPGVPANVSALYNINNAVTHKPDMGVEVGLMARYGITRNLRFRTGLQFNVSRYDIRAFSYVPEVATIALNNGFWTDSVRTISNYRNLTGGRSNWLQNIYFQASLPVGMELRVLGNNKNSFGIASSIQPTYLIGNRAYAITADYKNYARVPWLTRRWNMNTNLEAFVTLRNRKTEWQVGPQVRYQLLSSFIQEYPVKENLFDYGLKVGVKLR